MEVLDIMSDYVLVSLMIIALVLPLGISFIALMMSKDSSRLSKNIAVRALLVLLVVVTLGPMAGLAAYANDHFTPADWSNGNGMMLYMLCCAISGIVSLCMLVAANVDD